MELAHAGIIRITGDRFLAGPWFIFTEQYFIQIRVKQQHKINKIMNLVIVTAIHNRYDMTKAFLHAMRRIEHDTGVKTFASVSREDDACCDLCDEYGIRYVRHANKPVGKKFNAAVRLAKEDHPSHVMILGSDDIPSTSFIEHSLSLKGDIIGILDMYFWGLNPRRAGFLRFGHWPTKSLLGAGKILSKEVLDICDWAPWPDDANYGMDGKMMKRLSQRFMEHRFTAKTNKWRPIKEGVFLVDIKYGLHISSLSPIIRRGMTTEDEADVLPRYLPQDEIDYLMGLKEKVIKQYEEKHGLII